MVIPDKKQEHELHIVTFHLGCKTCGCVWHQRGLVAKGICPDCGSRDVVKIKEPTGD